MINFLKNNRYYSMDEQRACFKSRLLYNAQGYSIYVRNGLVLKNLLDGRKQVFQNEEGLNDFMNLNSVVCIMVETDDFEKEYQRYYQHLLQHGHEYTANDKEYKPGKIAMTLADMFGGQVDFYGIPFYAEAVSTKMMVYSK